MQDVGNVLSNAVSEGYINYLIMQDDLPCHSANAEMSVSMQISY